MNKKKKEETPLGQNYLAQKERTSLLIYVFCVGIGLLARVSYLIIYYIPVRDSYSYIEYIRQWEETGKIPEVAVPPFAMFLLKIPYHYWQYDIMIGGTIMNMMMGLFIILEIMFAINLLFNSPFATLSAGLIAATHPKLVQYSVGLLRENSYLMFICLSGVSLCYYFKKNKIEAIIGCGIFVAMCNLCRIEGIEILFICTLIIAFSETNGHRDSILKKLICIMLIIVSYVSTLFILARCLNIDEQDFIRYFEYGKHHVDKSLNDYE